ncbi:MAG: MaoC family dehydratase [Acidimicrobiales bacterium]
MAESVLNIDEALPGLAALRGQNVGVSDWKLIDQAAIDQFTELTGDGGPIHNDPVQAKAIAPFGGTIVQGFMLLSCLTGFAKGVELPQDGVAFRMNYGFDRVRIVSPVPVGARVRGRFIMRDLAARGDDAALMTLEAVVEIENSEKPALVADWLAYLQLGPSAVTP